MKNSEKRETVLIENGEKEEKLVWNNTILQYKYNWVASVGNRVLKGPF